MKMKSGNAYLKKYYHSKLIIPYTKKISKVFEQYFNVQKAKDVIPKILPANGHDICNYVARYKMANFQIQTVMKLDGLLDYDKLVRAVRLSIDEQPVLGCRFVEGEPPYWKRLDNIDKVEFCSYEETNDMDEAIGRYLESPLDMDKGPVVKVGLIRSGLRDAVCVKINHACSDGAGAKEYNQLLAEIYTAIDKENGAFIPKPKIGGRKDQDKLLRKLSLQYPFAGWDPMQDAPKSIWTFPWKPGWSNHTSFAVARLPVGQLDALSNYGKPRGATIHDLILTAYYKAMFEISHAPYRHPMDIGSTIDLRRYLPDGKAEAIRNLSGGFTTRVPRIKQESFENTLSRVVRETSKIKSGIPGLQNIIGGELVEKMSFTQFNNYFKAISHVSKLKAKYPVLSGYLGSPGFSNVGFVSKSLIKFGENIVTDAYIVPPAIRAPGILLLACSYNGVLTLMISFFKSDISQKKAEKLINKIKEELMAL